MRRVAVRVAGLVGLGLVVLVVQAVIAANREYLPSDPGFAVEGTVGDGGDGGGGDGDGPPLRLAVLGDSTVAGVGSPTAAESLPFLIAERVADGAGRRVEVLGLGVSGARTADVAGQATAVGDADVVVVVIGSNDVVHATPFWSFDEATRAMLSAVRAETGAVVVLGGIPLFETVPALDRPLREVVQFYSAPLRRAQRAGAARVPGVTYTEIAARASPRFAGLPEAMSADGFHPSPIGYGFWADALAGDVAAALAGDVAAALAGDVAAALAGDVAAALADDAPEPPAPGVRSPIADPPPWW